MELQLTKATISAIGWSGAETVFMECPGCNGKLTVHSENILETKPVHCGKCKKDVDIRVVN